MHEGPPAQAKPKIETDADQNQASQMPKQWPTMEEAKALDLQDRTRLAESSVAEFSQKRAMLKEGGTPEEFMAPESGTTHWARVRELVEFAQNGKDRGAVELVRGLSPEAQEKFAKLFYDQTIDSVGAPTGEALRTYQQYFAGTPFGNKYKQLFNEARARRGGSPFDIDSVRY